MSDDVFVDLVARMRAAQRRMECDPRSFEASVLLVKYFERKVDRAIDEARAKPTACEQTQAIASVGE